jgi:D-glycerate 3-kinase
MTEMSWSNARQVARSLMADLRLPESFELIVRDIYLPLAERIIARKHDQPLLISINGAQGTGKSTLTTFLKHIIESEQQYSVAAFSLDDFYLTRSGREQLAKQVHPLLLTRGVPGTHDLGLMVDVIDALMNRHACKAPRFDKAIDDRYPESEWYEYEQPVDIILFEGWCNSSPFQSSQELAEPVNELEAEEDREGVWRDYCNDKLQVYHQQIFDHADMSIMLKAPDFERIYEWRRLQEHKLRASTPSDQQHRIMDDDQLRRFIQHYERISRHTLEHLPEIADIVLPITAEHAITGIEQKHEQ